MLINYIKGTSFHLWCRFQSGVIPVCQDQPAKTSAKLPPKDAPAEKPKRKRVPKPVVESKDPDTKRKLAIAKAVGCVARQSEKDETKEGEVPAKKADETAVDDTQVP